jgi:addiction module HigA family antidote
MNLIHPSEIILHFMNELEMSTEDFADKMNICPKILNNMLNKNLTINEELAEKLSFVFGNSKQFWLNIQKRYEIEIQNKHQLNM